LPPGIALSASGLLSGTPTQIGGFLFTVAVTDSSGGTGPYTLSQQMGIIVTPPGFSYDATTQILTITGTAAANKFDYSQASTQDAAGNIQTTSTYTLNGVALSVPDALLNAVDVTAQGNNNTAILVTNDTYIGIDGLRHETYESVNLFPGSSQLFKYTASGSFSTVNITGFLTIYAYVGYNDTGKTGSLPDVATGSLPGPYIFVTAGSYCYLTGPDQYYEISGAANVYGYTTSSSDQAWHYDTAGLDAFVSSGYAYSYMSGTDAGQSFFNEAVGFQVTYAIATHGQSYAYLIDSPGNDVFVGYARYSYLSGGDALANCFNVAEGFVLVFGESFVGGTDYAYNYDPSHNILNSRWILLT
jgi:hypothetical protein